MAECLRQSQKAKDPAISKKISAKVLKISAKVSWEDKKHLRQNVHRKEHP